MEKVSFLFLTVVFLSTTSCYDFNRRQNELDKQSDGKAMLLEAEFSKKAQVEDAKAKNEAATLNAEAKIKIAKAEAQAEIERARGVAEANRIIGESLRNNQEYLEYLKIDAMRNSKGDKIYIPTEAMMPITEAK